MKQDDRLKMYSNSIISCFSLSLSPLLLSPSLPSSQARSPRPPTVEKLLQQYGLQQYVEVLIANGYDDIQFLGEVPDLELQEIGILDPSDRARVRLSMMMCAITFVK